MPQAGTANGGLLDAFIENKFSVDEKRLNDCPQLPTWRRAKTGLDDGTYSVPGELKPGTYETTAHLTAGEAKDCYWERRRGGKIAANDFVVGAAKVRVPVRQGDEDFTSEGCGNWVKV
jgi:hypothetical protein